MFNIYLSAFNAAHNTTDTYDAAVRAIVLDLGSEEPGPAYAVLVAEQDSKPGQPSCCTLPGVQKLYFGCCDRRKSGIYLEAETDTAYC